MENMHDIKSRKTEYDAPKSEAADNPAGKGTTDIFRGVAAIMVVLSHYAEWYAWFIQPQGKAETLRLALTKLGVYGVDIFFLLSGYALVRSLGDAKVRLGFVWKRIRNVFIPYVIITGVIEIISGGFTSLKDFWLYISGYDYWYMNALFVFYIGFMMIYAFIGNKAARIVLLSLFVSIYSFRLYELERADFWFVSNITFVIGVISAEFGQAVKKFVNKFGIYLEIILFTAMLLIVKSGLNFEYNNANYTPEQQIQLKITATIVWSLLILLLCAKTDTINKTLRRPFLFIMADRILAFIGKSSLYIYLFHTFIFMRCMNSPLTGARLVHDNNNALMAIMAVSVLITVVISYICKLLFDMAIAKIRAAYTE